MRHTKLLALVLLTTLSFPGLAASAADLDLIPISARCQKESFSLEPLFDRRDEGMRRDDALAIVDRMREVPISRRAVQLAYDFPKLPRDGLSFYTLWTCHALENFVAARPLQEISAELEQCFAKPTWDRNSCSSALQLKVLGLPANFQSRAPKTLIAAPPVPRPIAASQPASNP